MLKIFNRPFISLLEVISFGNKFIQSLLIVDEFKIHFEVVKQGILVPEHIAEAVMIVDDFWG